MAALDNPEPQYQPEQEPEALPPIFPPGETEEETRGAQPPMTTTRRVYEHKLSAVSHMPPKGYSAASWSCPPRAPGLLPLARLA
jgi:hypothetical protein